MPINVVVTGGGTIAPIDDVRAITNASTGRFSAAIAEACLERGARVWHVHTPTAERPFDRSARLDLDASDSDAEAARLEGVRRRYQAQRDRLHLIPLASGTVAEYARALRSALHAGPADVAFLAMAVSDYEPEPSYGKIGSDRDELLLRCRPTPKVIRSVRDWCPTVYLVGFKLLSGSTETELIAAAERACRANRADATVANDLRTLRAGRHAVHLVRPDRPPEALGPGPDLADRVVGRVLSWVSSRGECQG